ncbi:MAG: D-glycerate dehydrogenase [Thaumarchaeota archaeon]|nr:D-glycerate dehydrogenase [Nitrososphaerota archaeon]
MRRLAVYVTRNIPKAVQILSGSCDLTIHKKSIPPSKREIIKNVEDKDGLLCSLSDNIDSEVITCAKRLKVISSYSVGYDHIDIEAATKHGICVTYTPEVLTETTADLAFALLLATARRVAEADALVRKGKWGNTGWKYDFMLGSDIYGKTLGIIGLGRIGSAVARRAKGFSMNVLYHNRNRLSLEKENELSVKYRSLEDLLKESDFVSIHLPLAKNTFHLLNEQKLKLMKPTAYLINTARGSIVDERALIKALQKKWIAGAGLDVFEKEPLSNKQLLKFKNVVLAPHIGSASTETREKMAEVAAVNLLNVLNGKKPLYTVNPETLNLPRE